MSWCRGVALPAAFFAMLSCQLSALTPQEASQYIGKQGAVDGIAVQVSQAKGHVFVNFGARYPNQVFTVFVDRTDVPAIGFDYLKSLEGRPVSVVGRITGTKGRAQIQVTKKDQIILAVKITPR
jgi:hypothetical protein